MRHWPAEPIRRGGHYLTTSIEESPMIRVASAIVIAAAMLCGTAAFGQQNQPRETMPAQTDSHSKGTAPEGMGSSGWTGGTGGSHIGTSNSHTTGAAPPPAPNADQPEMATGQDLKGPPTRFPANKTPE
jgi:hypothetical protein